MLFLMANQQCQRTDGKIDKVMQLQAQMTSYNV